MFKKFIFFIFVIILLINKSVFAAPSIISINDTASAYDLNGNLPKYEKFELTFSLDSTYSNPYNYDALTGGVKIDAYFTHQESGLTDTVAAFWFQGYTRENINNTEVLTINGSPCWKVRYTPDTTGNFDYTITLSDSTGEYILPLPEPANSTFSVVDSGNKGFIRINKKNPKYFAFDDESLFFGIGMDVAFWDISSKYATKTYAYDAYFSNMKQNNMNFARLFTLNGNGGQFDMNWVVTIQQGYNNIGKNYDLIDAWRLDTILESAKNNGVYIQLCLEDVNAFTYNWETNIYSTTNGGYCSTRTNIFVNEDAKKSWKQLYRYFIARYGYSTNLASWELWNEINELEWSVEMWRGESWDWDNIIAWHSEMAQVIKSLDVNRHLITTSTGNAKIFTSLYALPEIDYGQIHSYYIPNNKYPETNYSSPDMYKLISYHSEYLRTSVPNKPNVIGEFGPSGTAKSWFDSTAPNDTTGLHVHNALWTGVFNNLAATPLNWYWSEHFQQPLWFLNYKVLSNYLEGENLSDTSLIFASSRNSNLVVSNSGFEEDLTGWTIAGTISAIDTTVYYESTKSLKWTTETATIASVTKSIRVVPSQEYTITWWMKMDSVAAANYGINAGVGINDGSKRIGESLIWNSSPYYKGNNDWQQYSYTFTSPPYTADTTTSATYTGLIRLNFRSATGSVWMDNIKLSASGMYAPSIPSNSNIIVLTKKSSTKVLGWIHNFNNTWYNIGDLGNIVTPESGNITIPSMAAGTYSVEWWDTYSTTGTAYRKQKARVSDNALNLSLPAPLVTDVAIKVKPSFDTAYSTLDWTGESEYTTCGVYPQSGYSDEIFTFRVKYTDPGNCYPAYIHLMLDKNGDNVYSDSGEIFDMDEADTTDNNFADGKIYYKTMAIPYPNGKTISHKFEASDGISFAAGAPASVVNLPVIKIKLSLSISSSEVDLKQVHLSSFSQPSAITVTNNSNEGSSSFTLQITGSVLNDSSWSPGAVAGKDIYVLKAIFTEENEVPSAGDFGDDDIVTTEMKTASPTNFGDIKFSKNGVNVTAGSAVKLWLLFKTPKSSSSQNDENIGITIDIIESK